MQQYQHPLATACECFDYMIHYEIIYLHCVMQQQSDLVQLHLSTNVSLQTLHYTLPRLQNNMLQKNI